MSQAKKRHVQHPHYRKKHAGYQKIIKITVIYRNSSMSRNVMIGSWLFFLVQKQCVCITTELHANTPMQSLLII